MRKILPLVALVAVLLVVTAAVVVAQTEPTLEERVTDLEGRVGLLEAEVFPSPSVSPSPSPQPSPSPPPTPVVSPCMARASLTVLPASGSFTMASYPDEHAFDARGYVSTAYPVDNDPIEIGDVSAGLNPCMEGGSVTGQQPRSYTWQQVKAIGWGAMRFVSDGGLDVDGFYAENVQDGIILWPGVKGDPTNGNGWTIRNTRMEYIRDDCIENDWLLGGRILDSMLECFVFVALAPSGSPAPGDHSSQALVIDGALVHMRQMPDGVQADRLNGGALFKQPPPQAPHVVMRDSIILVEKPNDVGEWPAGIVLENVTVVLESAGTLSLNPLPGMTVISDISVWNTAKADWLARHGAT